MGYGCGFNHVHGRLASFEAFILNGQQLGCLGVFDPQPYTAPVPKHHELDDFMELHDFQDGLRVARIEIFPPFHGLRDEKDLLSPFASLRPSAGPRGAWGGEGPDFGGQATAFRSHFIDIWKVTQSGRLPTYGLSKALDSLCQVL